MKKRAFSLLILIVGVGVLVQCKRADDVEPTDENELITTLKLSFSEVGNSASPQVFIFRDVDGEGGNPPSSFDKVVLKPGTSYTLRTIVQDESRGSVEDLTTEIASRAEEHLFVYTASPAGLLTYQYGDKDSRNHPIGLMGTATTGAAGKGKLRVRLRHQPPVGGVVVKDGTVGPGSDDINLDFDLEVK